MRDQYAQQQRTPATQQTPSQQVIPADLAHVDTADPRELAYWTQYFGCTEERLHEAVSLMGGDIARVRAYLRRFR